MLSVKALILHVFFMARLADSLGVSTDSIIKHLDSIWQRLDPDIQDSILKYQKYATDNFDSVLYGKGKGFFFD